MTLVKIANLINHLSKNLQIAIPNTTPTQIPNNTSANSILFIFYKLSVNHFSGTF